MWSLCIINGHGGIHGLPSGVLSSLMSGIVFKSSMPSVISLQGFASNWLILWLPRQSLRVYQPALP